MNNMFHNCISLSSLSDLSKWNIDKVWETKSLFYQCIDLLYIPKMVKKKKKTKKTRKITKKNN